MIDEFAAMYNGKPKGNLRNKWHTGKRNGITGYQKNEP
jgi:hypothetical protein